ncbi:sulfatase-like hydrolase/transferase [Rubritalea tangerina]|uniref:sulfatase-like hydrolase/transferase n=1 Tax=Rubritalea tangerina TaxID=430798 RepID=UPI00361F388B
MKRTLLTLTALFASLAACYAKQQPNILFFLVDDMGTQDTSVPFAFDEDGAPLLTKNNKTYRTPNMERLAKQGMRFTQAYAYTICSPSRVSLLTGQAAPRHKVTQWTHPKTYKTEPGPAKTKTIKSPQWNTKGVPQNTHCFLSYSNNRYATLFAGKAHFGQMTPPWATLST